MKNKEYFTDLKNTYKKGLIDRDDVIEDIEQVYCDKLIFEDKYDKMEYIVKLIRVWDIFGERA